MIVHDYENDPRSDEELIEAALSFDPETHFDEYHDVVTTFYYRGTREELDLALRLCRNEDIRKRMLGVDILNHLVQHAQHVKLPDEAEAFLTEISRTVFAMLETEEDPWVLNALARVLGFLKDTPQYLPAIIPVLERLASHPHENVRFAVACALGGIEDERAVQLLLRLMTDEDEDVRNWATFGLGANEDLDSPLIRDALAARLTDENPDARGEALCGLAKRGDPRAVEALLSFTVTIDDESTYEGEALVEAGITTGDPRLLPLLESLRDAEALAHDGNVSEELLQALAACRGEFPADGGATSR